jgi:hypothetical protein
MSDFAQRYANTTFDVDTSDNPDDGRDRDAEEEQS